MIEREQQDFEDQLTKMNSQILKLSQNLKKLHDWKKTHEEDNKKVKKKANFLFRERQQQDQDLVESILQSSEGSPQEA